MVKHNRQNVSDTVTVPSVLQQATSPAEERNDITVVYNKMTLREVQQAFNLNVSAEKHFRFSNEDFNFYTSSPASIAKAIKHNRNAGRYALLWGLYNTLQ